MSILPIGLDMVLNVAFVRCLKKSLLPKCKFMVVHFCRKDGRDPFIKNDLLDHNIKLDREFSANSKMEERN